MGPWHSGRISIQHWRHKNSVRFEGDPKGVGWFFQLEAGQDCVTYRSAIGYRIVHCVLRHGYVAVTPSFQLLICGTLDLNILPYTLAAITFKRGPLHQTAAMATGILTTQKQGENIRARMHTNVFQQWCVCTSTCLSSSVLYARSLPFSITLHSPLLYCHT